MQHLLARKYLRGMLVVEIPPMHVGREDTSYACWSCVFSRRRWLMRSGLSTLEGAAHVDTLERGDRLKAKKKTLRYSERRVMVERHRTVSRRFGACLGRIHLLAVLVVRVVARACFLNMHDSSL